jgi:hypothetical protein
MHGIWKVYASCLNPMRSLHCATLVRGPHCGPEKMHGVVFEPANLDQGYPGRRLLIPYGTDQEEVPYGPTSKKASIPRGMVRGRGDRHARCQEFRPLQP